MTGGADELLERAATGDRDAVDSLLAHYLPGLRAFVRLRAGRDLRARETSGDLVQSVCREILEHADLFQFGGAAGFKRWLYRTALRKIARRHEYYHAAKRDVDREVRPAAPGHAHSDDDVLACYQSFCTPSRHASAREELQRIERAFDRLPDHYREVILLARVMGMSGPEIGERLGKSEGAVRTMLSRAMALLADHLAGAGG